MTGAAAASIARLDGCATTEERDLILDRISLPIEGFGGLGIASALDTRAAKFLAKQFKVFKHRRLSRSLRAGLSFPAPALALALAAAAAAAATVDGTCRVGIRQTAAALYNPQGPAAHTLDTSVGGMCVVIQRSPLCLKTWPCSTHDGLLFRRLASNDASKHSGFASF